MKYTYRILALFLVGLVTTVPAVANADLNKPVLVVSIESYDRVMDDLEQLGQIANMGGIKNMAELMVTLRTGGRGLEGLDKTRPVGFLMLLNETDMVDFSFVPVTDIDKLLAVLELQLGAPEDVGDGIKKFSPPEAQLNLELFGGQGQLPGGFPPELAEELEKAGAKQADQALPEGIEDIDNLEDLGLGNLDLPETSAVYVKEHKGYALFSNNKAILTSELPDDPAVLLGDLPKNYTIGARLNVSNVPKQVREEIVASMQLFTGMFLQPLPDEDPEQFERRKQVAAATIEELTEYATDTDYLLAGWKVDAKARKTFVDFQMAALPDTSLAKRLGSQQSNPSDFAAFLKTDAAVAGLYNVDVTPTPEEVAKLELRIEEQRHLMKEQLTSSVELSDDEREALERIADRMLDLMTETIKSGKIDAGMLLTTKPHLNFVAGGHIADPNAVETSLKEYVKEFADERFAPKVTWDSSTHAGYRFHTLQYDVAENKDLSEMFGDTLTVVFGIGNDGVMMGMGNECLTQIKRVLDASADSTENAPSMHFTVAVGPLVEMAAEADKANLLIQQANIMLRGAKGRDHVIVSTVDVENGVGYRIEAEEGVIKLMPLATQALMPLLLQQQQAPGGIPGGKPLPFDESEFDELEEL